MTRMDTYGLWTLISNRIPDMAKSVDGGNNGVTNPIYAVTPKGWKVILLKFWCSFLPDGKRILS